MIIKIIIIIIILLIIKKKKKKKKIIIIIKPHIPIKMEKWKLKKSFMFVI